MINRGAGITISTGGGSGSGVDNIIVVANAAALPALGTTEGKILYYTQNTQSWYHWDPLVPGWRLILDDSDHANLTTVISGLAAHLADGTAAHAASAISSVPSGNLAADDVQEALDELQTNIDALQVEQDNDEIALANHLVDAADAHDASAISNVAAGNLAATDVQGALNELQGDIDVINNRGYSTAANSALADASTPNFTGTPRLVQRVSGSGGSVTLADLAVTSAEAGDELVLIGTDSANTVTIVSATNTVVNGSCTLGDDDMITFLFIDAQWKEQSRSA